MSDEVRGRGVRGHNGAFVMTDSATAIELAEFAPGSKYAEGAAQVFADTWHRSLEDAIAFLGLQADYPDYRGLVALADGRVVGMVFGTASESGQWWHDRVAARVGESHPALRDAWVLTELAVLEDWRGQGIGARLHDEVLAAQPHPRALLSTEISNMRARRMYERRGWRYIHPGFPFEPGRESFVVMAKEL